MEAAVPYILIALGVLLLASISIPGKDDDDENPHKWGV